MSTQTKTPEVLSGAEIETEVIIATANSESVISAFLSSIGAIDEALAYYRAIKGEVDPASKLVFHLLGARNGLVEDPRFVQDEIGDIDRKVAEYGHSGRETTTTHEAVDSLLDLRYPFAEILMLEQMYNAPAVSEPANA